MKRLSIVMLFAALSFMAKAQNENGGLKNQIEVGLNVGLESFFSSDLSILDNQPQEKYFASSIGINVGMNVCNNISNGSFGLDFILTTLQPNNDEDIDLIAAGIYSSDYFPFNDRFGCKTFIGVYWRYYSNSFSVDNKDYDYKKHGMMASVLAGLYFKPNKKFYIETCLKSNMTCFWNNDKNIDGIASTLPKNSLLTSITPTIGIKMMIP